MAVRYREKQVALEQAREVVRTNGYIEENISTATVDGQRAVVPINVLYTKDFKRIGRVTERDLMKLLVAEEIALTQRSPLLVYRRPQVG